MALGTIPEPLAAKYKDSFAYPTITQRAPVILTRALDTLHREWRQFVTKQFPNLPEDQLEQAHDEAKILIGEISKLKYMMQTNKPLEDLQCHLLTDYDHWQQTLKRFTVNNDPPTWFESPWLLVECYMYRKLADLCATTKYLTSYDPFQSQKRATLFDNLASIRLIATFLSSAEPTVANVESWFELSLWGNRCDLSLKSTTPAYENVLDDLKTLRAKILVNDMDQLMKQVSAINDDRTPGQFIDLVLDNSGFELYTDLCLFDRLTRIFEHVNFRIHVKSYPWFVSDVNLHDLNWVLDTLQQDTCNDLSSLASQWKSWIKDGRWTVQRHFFWTYYEPFYEMNQVAPDLYSLLAQSSLIIFKGDLNYRKLLGDLNWPHSTPFDVALRGFQPAFLVTLRTNKADLVAGFDSSKHPKLPDEWLVSGEYALIQIAKKA